MKIYFDEQSGRIAALLQDGETRDIVFGDRDVGVLEIPEATNSELVSELRAWHASPERSVVFTVSGGQLLRDGLAVTVTGGGVDLLVDAKSVARQAVNDWIAAESQKVYTDNDTGLTFRLDPQSRELLKMRADRLDSELTIDLYDGIDSNPLTNYYDASFQRKSVRRNDWLRAFNSAAKHWDENIELVGVELRTAIQLARSQAMIDAIVKQIPGGS